VQVSGIAVGRRRQETVDRLLAAARAAEPNYDHVGSTLATAPPGIGAHRESLTACGTLAEARAAMDAWAPHTGIRGRVIPVIPPALGETVCVIVPFGPVEMCVPDRIVAVVDEPDAVGFAYGTLPGHPERGEELFMAESVLDGRLRLSVTVHAVPASLPARVGAPLTRLLQHTAANRYLDAWARAIADLHP
jgi:uncharacterized protein (UPF0548 family)